MTKTKVQTTKVRPNINERIAYALSESTQPLSVAEVRAKLRQMTGKDYHITYVYTSLKEMTATGETSARRETVAERDIRSGGRVVRGNEATLYWAPGTEQVPARTVQVAVSGEVLDPSEWTGSTFKVKKSKKTKTQVRQNPSSVSAMIELLIQERTMKLEIENADLRDKLKAISSITQA